MQRLTASLKQIPRGVRFQSTAREGQFGRDAQRTQRAFKDTSKWRGGQKHLNFAVDQSGFQGGKDYSRIAPATPLQYTGRGSHEQTMEVVNRIRRQYEHLPRNREGVLPPKVLGRESYLLMLGSGESISGPQHNDLSKALADLHYIDNQLKPQVVKDLLRRFTRGGASGGHGGEVVSLDDQGRAVTIGRRKTSSAKVIVTKAPEGTTGEFRVNGMLLSQYFQDLQHRAEVLFPLSVVQSETKYNIFATTVGGGNSGKAGAIALGVARGVIVHNPLLRKRLSKAGCLTRDARTKERKKPGLRRARAAPTWVKR